METNFEYLAKILKDDAIDTWTLREQEEINKLDLTQGLHIFLYDIYTGIISHCQTTIRLMATSKPRLAIQE